MLHHFVVPFFVAATTSSFVVGVGGQVLGTSTSIRKSSECSSNGYYRDSYSYREGDPEMSRMVYYVGQTTKPNTTHIINEFSSKQCKLSSSTAKLEYTSKGVCTIKFHTIVAKETVQVPDGYLSTLCSDDNIVESLKVHMINDPPQEKLYSWPDVCVGDYQRCYDIKRNRDILLRHMCTAETTQLRSIPTETTHVSVDCRDDKVKKIEWLQQAVTNDTTKNSITTEQNVHDKYIDAQKQRSHEFFKFILFLSTIATLICGICVGLVHRHVFTPLLKTLKRTRSDLNLNGYNDKKKFNHNKEFIPLCPNTNKSDFSKSAESPI
jgi:hypothetical protein